MAVGLTTRTQDGRIKTSPSTSTYRIFGVITVGGAGAAQSGQIQDDRFRQGRPFFFSNCTGIPGGTGAEAVFSISDNVLSWNFRYSDSSRYNRPNQTVLYGVY